MLIIYLPAANEAYSKMIIDNIICIRTHFGLTDAMTKPAILLAFLTSVKKNQLNYKV